jgi:hypothetical protein
MGKSVFDATVDAEKEVDQIIESLKLDKNQVSKLKSAIIDYAVAYAEESAMLDEDCLDS